jgi:TolB-like protein/cytochrome c-type biogenesis protein CcmH/NrfG
LIFDREDIALSEASVQFFFSDHMLDTDTRELWRDEVAIAVQPQVFDLLAFLVRNRERVVSKDELFAALWGGRRVADSTLATHVNAARKAIGDSGEEQRLLRTIARKGIRFVGEVQSSGTTGESVQGVADAPRLAAQPPERPSIAVLPFNNMSGEAEQEYFSDGISEDVITALSKLRWFFVIARNSSFSYKGKAVHIRQIAEDLGVSYVVEGSVRKEGGRVRITAQLIDAANGSHLWAERYDRNLADVFAVQDEITQAIVATVEPKLYDAEHFRGRRKAPDSLDAWDLVMRALRHFWRMSREDNLLAQGLLEQAIALDPDFAQAQALLAVSCAFGVHNSWQDGAVAVPIAERAAMAAVRIDNEDPWAHLGAAFVHARLGRTGESLASFDTALRLNPSFSLAHGCRGLVLIWDGQWQEGVEAAERALRLSPRDPYAAIYHGVAAYAAYVERDYAKCVALCRKSIRQRSDFVGSWRVMAAAAGMAGDTEVAAEALREFRRSAPNITLARAESQLAVKDPAERKHFIEGLRRAGLT